MKYVYIDSAANKIIVVSNKKLETHSYLDCYSVQDDFDLSKVITEKDGQTVTIPNSISADDFLRKYKSNYVQQRINEYPSIEDQLDAIFHGGIDFWKSEIQKIKDKYPKQ